MKKHAAILDTLATRTGEDYCALIYRNIFELAVAVILSAQCTDKRVNMVTPALFRAYPSVEAFAHAELQDIEKLIHSTGFYRNKAKHIKGLATIIHKQYNGHLPQTMEELTALPGIARKTANVILSHGMGIIAGITVDTHVLRVSHRLGLTSQAKNAEITERELMELYPRKDWPMVATSFLYHGRTICDAKKPQCAQCPVQKHCTYYTHLTTS